MGLNLKLRMCYFVGVVRPTSRIDSIVSIKGDFRSRGSSAITSSHVINHEKTRQNLLPQKWCVGEELVRDIKECCIIVVHFHSNRCRVSVDVGKGHLSIFKCIVSYAKWE